MENIETTLPGFKYGQSSFGMNADLLLQICKIFAGNTIVVDNGEGGTEELQGMLVALNAMATAQTATANKYTVTGSGVITAGKRSVTLIARGSDCTIFGDVCEDGRDYTFSAPDRNMLLSEITYDGGTGSFEILEIS